MKFETIRHNDRKYHQVNENDNEKKSEILFCMENADIYIFLSDVLFRMEGKLKRKFFTLFREKKFFHSKLLV